MWFYKRVSVCLPIMALHLCVCSYCVQHEKEVVDLRKATELRGPDPQGNFEAQCSFQIVALGK